ncbi:unnamed protein product [Leptidea sinapis]|uniref:Uncharacterized protein n=1 Tax=Leptidea sinapis TaxID=189913 RepID=A0A5E4PLZ6_9NEOP|nr:unnamed protein product [Leptidea sinapis]
MQSLPLYNGFITKITPISMKERDTSSLADLLSKIPQDPTTTTHRNSSEEIYSNTNDIAKIFFPSRVNSTANVWKDEDYIKVPLIMKKPVEYYNILVATAPPNVKMNKTFVVYIVFPEDDGDYLDGQAMNIPSVYFVNKADKLRSQDRKQTHDLFFLINSNRTVTKVKSNDVSKHLRFRNKLTNVFEMKEQKEIV